jgi:hypothetical protein
MYENEKPKRKREKSGNSLDFVTALTVEQCVERLEKGPAHTLDYRLTVRTDGQRFVVEALGSLGGKAQGAQLVLADFQGHLERTQTGSTRVYGIYAKKNRYHPERAWELTIIILLLVLVALSNSPDRDDWMVVLFTSVLILLCTAVMYFSLDHYNTKLDEQTLDLGQWIKDQLSEPPEQQA